MADHGTLIRNQGGAAAAELALVTPMLLILMFGSVELGNYFMNEHALVKQVRDGARYASRLPLTASYSCDPATVTSAAETQVIDVTKTGQVGVSATTPKRMPFKAGDGACGKEGATVTVTVRCVDKDLYPGLWRGYDGDIPVVKVAGKVAYRPAWAPIGFQSANLCLRAESEMPVIGL